MQRISDHGEYEDAAVRRSQRAAECHGKTACRCRTDYARRNDSCRIRCGVGNCTLSDEAQSHDIVDRTVLAFFLGKPVLEERRCKCDRNRGNHAADHNRRHNIKVALRDRRNTEDIRGLVERAAHINGHHAAEDAAEQYLTGIAHAAEKIGNALIEQSHDRIDRAHHEIKRDFDFNTPNHDCTKVYVTIAGSGSLLEPVGDMPDLVGKVVNAAMPESIEELNTILHSDVQGTFIFDSASDAPAGTVLSQYPAPGEPVWKNENVIVYISRPEPSNEEFVSLPGLTGKTLSEAIGEIRSKGCEPFIGKKVYRPDLPDFTVIETEPGDLSHVRQGSGVRLIISVSKRQLADAE